MKIKYNSPVILTYTIITIIVYILMRFQLGYILYFVLPSKFQPLSLTFWWRCFSYIFGHSGINHLVGNMSMFIVAGPIVESRYGSKQLIYMIIITTLITGILHILCFENGLIGASGIVFMLIILSASTSITKKEIPLTFIIVIVFYIGKEIGTTFLSGDNISHFAHIIGGLFGATYGFLFCKKNIT